MNTTQFKILVMGAALGLLSIESSHAANFIARIGGHYFETNSDNALLEAEETGTLTLSLSYLWNENLGIEVLGAVPPKFDLALTGTEEEAAEVTSLPPAISLVYRFTPNARLRPYIGAGVNYSLFYDEETRDALLGSEIEVENSWGAIALAGADFMLNETWFINLDVRWLEQDPDLRVGAADAGSLDFDPLAVGLWVGREFSW